MPSLRGLSALSQAALAIATKGRAMLPALIFGRANVQHERIAGIAPPNGGRLQYAGHDHAFLGGLALPRGVRCGFDHGENTDLTLNIEGTSYAYDTYHPLQENRRVLFRTSATPGLTGTAVGGSAARMEGKVLVDVVSVSGTIDITLYNHTTNSRSDLISLTGTGFARGTWTSIPFQHGAMNEFSLEIKSNAACELIVYSAVLAETRTRTQPQQTATTYSSVNRP